MFEFLFRPRKYPSSAEFRLRREELDRRLAIAQREAREDLEKRALENPIIRQMMEDKNFLVRSFEDSRQQVRSWALEVLCCRLNEAEDLDWEAVMRVLEQFAFSQAATEERARALCVLGVVVNNYGTRERKLSTGTILADVVLDRSEALEVRQDAYTGLLAMISSARELTNKEWMFPFHEDRVFSDQINWEYVCSWKY